MKFMIIQNPSVEDLKELTYTIVLDRVIGTSFYKHRELFSEIQNEIKKQIDNIYISDLIIKNASIETIYDEKENDIESFDTSSYSQLLANNREFEIITADDPIYIEFSIHFIDEFDDTFETIKHSLITIFTKYKKQILKSYIDSQRTKTKVEVINLNNYKINMEEDY